MTDQSNAKEKIIAAATELINESSGNISDITARSIAQKANIGLGLINYHFGSKDALIEECVQRIINNVVFSFKPKLLNMETSKERLTACAGQVFAFLFDNPSVSRISILGDMKAYGQGTNTSNTQQGFMRMLGDEIDSDKKELLTFTLTGAMQTAFLSSFEGKPILKYDFSKAEERDKYISDLVNLLFESIV